MRTITIVCWIVAAMALAGLAIWFLTGTVFGLRSDRLNGSNWGSRWSFGLNIGGIDALSGPFEEAGSYTAGTAGVKSINIDWVAGDITVNPYDGGNIKITE